jgi:hypothetical protein
VAGEQDTLETGCSEPLRDEESRKKAAAYSRRQLEARLQN